MRDIKVVNIGAAWVLLNPTKESVFFQSTEGALSFHVTNDKTTPSIGINGNAFPSLEYRTSSGGAYVWIKAAVTGRVLAGVFSSPGERVLFEGAYSTLQQAFQFTQQTEFPALVTALANVIETDTTHPVAASVIYEIGTAFGQALQGLAPLSSPAFTDTPTAPTALPGSNNTQLATTAYADYAAATAEQNANDYADNLVTGLWDDRGAFDASPGNYPSSGGSGLAGAILKGDIWTISVPGTIGTDVLEVGDTLRALVDNPDGEWAVGQNNIGWVPENVAKKVTTLAAPNNTNYPTTQAVADGLEGKAATAHGHAIGDVTGLQTALNGKEPSLPANVGSTKFLREDRTWQPVNSGDTVIYPAAASTMVLAANTNYVIMLAASCTLDANALTGSVRLVNMVAASSTVLFTFTAGTNLYNESGLNENSVVLSGFGTATVSRNPATPTALRVARPQNALLGDLRWYSPMGTPTYYSWTGTPGGVHALTLPAAAINFGDLPSVATTSGNSVVAFGRVLNGTANSAGGTYASIITGRNNSASVLESVVITGRNVNITKAAIGSVCTGNISTIAARRCASVRAFLSGNTGGSASVLTAEGTNGSQNVAGQAIPAFLTANTGGQVAVHNLRFIAQGSAAPANGFVGERRVTVINGAIVDTQTIGVDKVAGTFTPSIGISLGGNDTTYLLVIVKEAANLDTLWWVEVESFYNNVS